MYWLLSGRIELPILEDDGVCDHFTGLASPIALIRGYPYPQGDGTARDMVLEPERDLFR
jgi:hypothetical protein